MPETVQPSEVDARREQIERDGRLRLAGVRELPFTVADIRLSPRTEMAVHSNAMRLRAWDRAGDLVDDALYYSVGGGFVVRDGDRRAGGE